VTGRATGKDRGMENQEQHDRLEEDQAAVIPAREAMSLITSGSENLSADPPGEDGTNQDPAESQT